MPEPPEGWEQTLEALRARASYRSPQAKISPAVVLRQVLELEAEREFVASEELQRAFEPHLKERARPLAEREERRRQLLLLIASKELNLTEQLRAGLADFGLTGSFAAAIYEAKRLQRADPGRARQVAEALKAHSPELADALGPALLSGHRWQQQAPLRWLGVWTVFALAAVGIWAKDRFFTPPDPPAPPSAERAREAAVRGSIAAKKLDRHELTATALKIVDALDEKDCPTASREAASLREQIGNEPWRVEALKQLLDVAKIAEEMCPSRAP